MPAVHILHQEERRTRHRAILAIHTASTDPAIISSQFAACRVQSSDSRMAPYRILALW